MPTDFNRDGKIDAREVDLSYIMYLEQTENQYVPGGTGCSREIKDNEYIDPVILPFVGLLFHYGFWAYLAHYGSCADLFMFWNIGLLLPCFFAGYFCYKYAIEKIKKKYPDSKELGRELKKIKKKFPVLTIILVSVNLVGVAIHIIIGFDVYSTWMHFMSCVWTLFGVVSNTYISYRCYFKVYVNHELFLLWLNYDVDEWH